MGGYKLTLDTQTRIITGKGTYECKDVLKSKWKCTFDLTSKGWVLKNNEDMQMFIEMHQVKTENTPAPIPMPNSYRDGLCPKCGSYCYGDCTAH
jgi:hypothetical protein